MALILVTKIYIIYNYIMVVIPLYFNIGEGFLKINVKSHIPLLFPLKNALLRA